MFPPKVGAIGFFLLISLVLSTVAIFTKYWIVVYRTTVNDNQQLGVFGIIPYDSSNPIWFLISSVMMYMALGMLILSIIAYLHVSYKVHHHGYRYIDRHNFHSISALCSMIATFEIAAFVLMAIYASDYAGFWDINNHTISSKMGYSCYLALAAGICSFIPGPIAAHISRNDCPV